MLAAKVNVINKKAEPNSLKQSVQKRYEKISMITKDNYDRYLNKIRLKDEE